MSVYRAGKVLAHLKGWCCRRAGIGWQVQEESLQEVHLVPAPHEELIGISARGCVRVDQEGLQNEMGICNVPAFVHVDVIYDRVYGILNVGHSSILSLRGTLSVKLI